MGKNNIRCMPHLDSSGQLGADKSFSVIETSHSVLDSFFITQNTEVNSCQGKITCYIHIGDTDHPQPWVFYLSIDYVTNGTFDIFIDSAMSSGHTHHSQNNFNGNTFSL